MQAQFGMNCSTNIGPQMEAPMPTAGRPSTKLTLNRALSDEARALAAEQGIAAGVQMTDARRWREENAAAIEEYNRFIETGGVPLSEFRKF
jgi:antitoxin CcdA